MANLKFRHCDGKPYINGFLHGHGNFTWQLTKPGTRYLRGQGIFKHGDQLSTHQLEHLKATGLVFTYGADITGDSTGVPVWPEWVVDLVTRLSDWAKNGGGIAPLFAILQPTAFDHRSDCFSGGLLRWVSETCSDADSFSDFKSFTKFPATSVQPLFGLLLIQEEHLVIWRLSRIVADAKEYRSVGRTGSEHWPPESPMRWLIARLASHSGVPRKVTRSLKGPIIRWRVEDQAVVAELPGQILPDGVSGIAWGVSGQGKPVKPRPYKDGGKWRIPFSDREDSLPPAPFYRMTVKETNTSGRSWTWDRGIPDDALALFHPDGTLIDSESSFPMAGQYLALVKGAVAALPGVVFGEAISSRPMGWMGWSGWNVTVAANATVGGHVFGSKSAMNWSLSPPTTETNWLVGSNVYLGAFPQLRLETPDRFRGCELEMTTPNGDTLRIPCAEDFNAVARLQPLFGKFVMRCRSRTDPDAAAPALTFTRLPAMIVTEMPDTDTANAIRVTPTGAHFDLVAGSDTELSWSAETKSHLLRTTEPLTSPAVHARHPTRQWELQIRVGVSRARLQNRDGTGSWQALPIRGFDLGTVGLDDRLRVEFVTPLYTPDSSLECRLPGRPGLSVGERMGSVTLAHVFEVPLHRWRDHFGVGIGGMVQVRIWDRWIDVVELVGPPPVGRPPRADVQPWDVLTGNLWRALHTEDDELADRLCGECRAMAGTHPCAGDALPVAIAEYERATGVCEANPELDVLAQRRDLPEAELAVIAREIRFDRPDDWPFPRFRDIENRLDGRLPALLAECWYRFGRAQPPMTDAGWRSVYEESGHVVGSASDPLGVARSDAALLREFSRWMNPNDLGPDTVPAGVLPWHRRWIDGIRFAGQYLRNPVTAGIAPDLGGRVPTVLFPDDAALVRFAVALAANNPAMHDDWPKLGGADAFFGMPLLRARYYRRIGDKDRAAHEYGTTLTTAVKLDGAAWFLDAIIDERNT